MKVAIPGTKVGAPPLGWLLGAALSAARHSLGCSVLGRGVLASRIRLSRRRRSTRQPTPPPPPSPPPPVPQPAPLLAPPAKALMARPCEVHVLVAASGSWLGSSCRKGHCSSYDGHYSAPPPPCICVRSCVPPPKSPTCITHPPSRHRLASLITLPPPTHQILPWPNISYALLLLARANLPQRCNTPECTSTLQGKGGSMVHVVHLLPECVCEGGGGGVGVGTTLRA